MTEDDETLQTPHDEKISSTRDDHPKQLRRKSSPEETARLASVAFGGTPSDGRDGISQFGCPQCGAMVSAANADEDGKTSCRNCHTEVLVPEASAQAASELNEGMRPAALPTKREEKPIRLNEDPELDREVRTRLKRDNQHRLSPQLTPKLQPIEEVRATAHGSEDNWVTDETKYIGHATGTRRFFRFFRVLFILAIIGGGLWFLFNLKQSNEKEKAEPAPKTALQLEADKAAANLKQYVDMTEVNRKVLFTRHKEITLPRMLKYYNRRGIDPPVPVPRLHTAKESTYGDRKFLEFESDLRNRPVTVYFEKMPSGDYLVDWESMVGFSEMEWDMYLIREPAETQEFRLYAQWGDYYNHEFSDGNAYKCITLSHVESLDQLYAYVPINSEIHKKAILLLGENKSDLVPCRVKVRISNPGSQHRQGLIEEITEGWLVP